MPIQVRRFGVGQRRRAGPPGSVGVSGQVIHSDARGTVAELAFSRDGRIEPHASPNTTWFIVIEGGGWVVVDDERIRVAAGEAVLWPAGVPHAAWADHGPMRAFVVEYAGPDDSSVRGVLEGRVRELAAGGSRAARGEGTLTSPRRRAARQTIEGEPD
jgi:quercetin dioxygenase-like cupin family protein